jgi:hypothetical protein
MVKYSVPARLIGRRVRVSLQASRVKVFDGRPLVADHPRRIARTGSVVDLDHYLEVLAFKPGALPGSTALAQARAAGVFTTAHEDFWIASRRVNGDADGTRQLIDVLLLHRSHRAEDVVAGIRAALARRGGHRGGRRRRDPPPRRGRPRVGPMVTVTSLLTARRSSNRPDDPSGWCR